MSEPARRNLVHISRKRRVKEDKRFVSGTGCYVQDVVPPGTRHVAVLTSPYPRARIISIDWQKAAALDGVHAVVTGEELAARTAPLHQALNLPHVVWRPLAVAMVRYAGEWVVAVAAEPPLPATNTVAPRSRASSSSAPSWSMAWGSMESSTDFR